jgi:hypothetical protein
MGEVEGKITSYRRAGINDVEALVDYRIKFLKKRTGKPI